MVSFGGKRPAKKSAVTLAVGLLAGARAADGLFTGSSGLLVPRGLPFLAAGAGRSVAWNLLQRSRPPAPGLSWKAAAIARTPLLSGGSQLAAASNPPTEPPRKMKYGETTQRSLVKAFGWRVTAAIITLASGLLFAKNLSVAATIVGSDFVTKSGFMFLGERVWNKVRWGQGAGGDSAKRSAAKAVLWRVFAAANTLICSAFLAGDLSVASKIAGTDAIVKTGLFFVNERIWNAIEWGKAYEVEYNI